MEGEVCSKGDGPPVYINCDGSHRVSSFDCPEYTLQRRSRELAACENISLAKVPRRIRGSTLAPQADYACLSTREFPDLPGACSGSRGCSVCRPSSALQYLISFLIL